MDRQLDRQGKLKDGQTIRLTDKEAEKLKDGQSIRLTDKETGKL
jgi:hypothetical protein